MDAMSALFMVSSLCETAAMLPERTPNARSRAGFTIAAVQPADVLEFWFGRDRKDWFAKSDAFDAEIRDRFLATYEAAAAGKLASWNSDARSCLALVIVLDQFPRNMFRGSARALAADALAREAARRILEQAWD